MSDEGYVLIKGPDLNEAPAMMSFEAFLLLWEDAHRQNPERWPSLSYSLGDGKKVELPKDEPRTI